MRALIDRREAATENIRFVFGTFSLGTVMVAASGKGIAAILMGDDREALRRELKGAFPHARLAENETALEGAMAKVIALLEAPPKGLDLPLDLPATAQEVGAACAANVLAVAVPCHRVVKADGSISGYRWGVRRTRTLIEREAAA
jgi:AraC family transcriptional regulator, regulatory protein of adaptative response / methylated-DNA-[protein]-cysteine methyltransferase